MGGPVGGDPEHLQRTMSQGLRPSSGSGVRHTQHAEETTMNTMQYRIQTMLEELAEQNQATDLSVSLVGTMPGGKIKRLKARWRTQPLNEILPAAKALVMHSNRNHQVFGRPAYNCPSSLADSFGDDPWDV